VINCVLECVGRHKAKLFQYFEKERRPPPCEKRRLSAEILGIFATFSKVLVGFERFMVVFHPQMHHLGSDPVLNRLYLSVEPDTILKLIFLYP
jgi:hypothetical protein